MKKLLCIMIAAISMLAASGAMVSADAIAEPSNEFYWDNPSECDFNSWRPFEVKEDSELLESPLGSTSNGIVKTGETVQVGFTYTDEKGVEWGCCSFFNYVEADGRKDGWVQMDKLEEIYNVFTFIDEHESEMRDYNGELDDYIPTDRVILWEYPFGENYNACDADKWYTKETYPYEKYDVGDKCWTDENGNVWIYCCRFIWQGGGRCDDCWIYLPAPETDVILGIKGTDISSENGTAVSGQLISDEDTEAAYNAAVEAINSGRRSNYILPLCLSGAAVILSGAAIVLLKNKN
ncbi:MAG: hypothetical protein MSJ26_11215 [Oscillospiraceae bacterium]|nr:hypothetical protein [Oscillospiraceae bacterium]